MKLIIGNRYNWKNQPERLIAIHFDKPVSRHRTNGGTETLENQHATTPAAGSR